MPDAKPSAGSAGSVAADVIFLSRLTNPEGTVTADVSMRVTDEVYASGIDFRLLYNLPGSPVTQADGLLAFDITVANENGTSANFTLANILDVQFPQPGSSLATQVDISLNSVPSGLPSGFYSLLTPISDQLVLRYDASLITGSFGSDRGALGCFDRPCSLAGSTEVMTAVPEPVSLASFGVGLACLGFVRGRRRH